MRRWRAVVLFAAALVAAAGLAVAGTYAMTEDETEPGLPFDSPEECEQYQIDNRVWWPPEACAPSMFTGDDR